MRENPFDFIYTEKYFQIQIGHRFAPDQMAKIVYGFYSFQHMSNQRLTQQSGSLHHARILQALLFIVKSHTLCIFLQIMVIIWLSGAHVDRDTISIDSIPHKRVSVSVTIEAGCGDHMTMSLLTHFVSFRKIEDNPEASWLHGNTRRTANVH